MTQRLPSHFFRSRWPNAGSEQAGQTRADQGREQRAPFTSAGLRVAVSVVARAGERIANTHRSNRRAWQIVVAAANWRMGAADGVTLAAAPGTTAHGAPMAAQGCPPLTSAPHAEAAHTAETAHDHNLRCCICCARALGHWTTGPSHPFESAGLRCGALGPRLGQRACLPKSKSQRLTLTRGTPLDALARPVASVARSMPVVGCPGWSACSSGSMATDTAGRCAYDLLECVHG